MMFISQIDAARSALPLATKGTQESCDCAEEICEIFCSGKSVRSFAGQKINQ